ncbi:hypothetical protein LVISKB_2295 [Levilactobacillus brevis KB290]|uniref:Uncharacterized protein n=1 Tax=Levilactobacillus brevis KB290 TaxID=1001583 RepID=M5AHM8_LEVBR|nr:hypothetical protein LVISKB_2295 [Levilactobacillus brevis KB290]
MLIIYLLNQYNLLINLESMNMLTLPENGTKGG